MAYSRASSQADAHVWIDAIADVHAHVVCKAHFARHGDEGEPRGMSSRPASMASSTPRDMTNLVICAYALRMNLVVSCSTHILEVLHTLRSVHHIFMEALFSSPTVLVLVGEERPDQKLEVIAEHIESRCLALGGKAHDASRTRLASRSTRLKSSTWHLASACFFIVELEDGHWLLAHAWLARVPVSGS